MSNNHSVAMWQEVEEHLLKKIYSFHNGKCMQIMKYGGQKNLYTVEMECHKRNWIFCIVISVLF
jgi:hypothetical protein